jgi:hypothetical protein
MDSKLTCFDNLVLLLHIPVPKNFIWSGRIRIGKTLKAAYVLQYTAKSNISPYSQSCHPSEESLKYHILHCVVWHQRTNFMPARDNTLWHACCILQQMRAPFL